MTSSSDQEKLPAMPPELERIAAEAAALKPQPETAPGEVAAPAVIDYTAEAKGVIDIAAELAGNIGPRTEAAFSEDRRQRLAAAAGPLMEKYGLSLGAIFGRWGAEINFLFALTIITPPIAKAIRADMAEAKAADQAEKQATAVADPQPPRPAGDAYQRAFAE